MLTRSKVQHCLLQHNAIRLEAIATGVEAMAIKSTLLAQRLGVTIQSSSVEFGSAKCIKVSGDEENRSRRQAADRTSLDSNLTAILAVP